MRFLVADTFAKSVASLDDRAQRSVKCAAFGFQMNPSQPSLRLHKLAHAKLQLRAEDIRLLVGGVTRHGGGAPDEAVAGEGRS